MSKERKSLPFSRALLLFRKKNRTHYAYEGNLRRVILNARKQRPRLLPRLKIGRFSAPLAIQICQFPIDTTASLVASAVYTALPGEKGIRTRTRPAKVLGGRTVNAEKKKKRRKRIRIFTNHSARHLREGKSPPPLKSEEVERFIESWDT